MSGGLAARFIRLKNTGPRWIGTAIDWALASDSVPLRVLKGRLAAGLDVPEPPHPDSQSRVRVLFAPFNYAGQGGEWARSINELAPSYSAQSLAVTAGGFGFHADVMVPLPIFVGSSEWRQRLDRALGEYTHVVIESFGSLFGRGTGKSVIQEVRRLQRRGVSVALLCHGSDIRSPKAASEREEFLTIEAWDKSAPSIERSVARNRTVLDELDGTVFVSTPDLLEDVPQGTWLPVVVESDRWEQAAAQGRRAGERERLRVVHAPSNAGLKGTDTVDAVASKLQAEGKIEYERLQGIPAVEMPAKFADADIVIDQLLLGSYGVTACEALAAGRGVISNVSPEVRDYVARETNLDLPIVQADPRTLESVLRELVNDRREFVRLAVEGPEFVRRVHAGSRTVEAMATFFKGDCTPGGLS